MNIKQETKRLQTFYALRKKAVGVARNFEVSTRLHGVISQKTLRSDRRGSL
jgi:hypothetical protein